MNAGRTLRVRDALNTVGSPFGTASLPQANNQGAVVDSVDETFLGSQVLLAAPKGYPSHVLDPLGPSLERPGGVRTPAVSGSESLVQ